MSVMFGSARIGENSSSSGNKAGDQSGSEVSTQAYYTHSKGWYGFAPKSADVAKKLAEAMQEACDNNHIGYDQSDRGTLLTQFKKTGSIKAITTNCECDCSSLVRVCIYQATGTLLSDFTTSDEPTVLANSGLFESKKSITAASQTSLGMILVTKTKGHTGIIVSGVSASGSTGSTSSGTTTGSLDVDGQWGKLTTTKAQSVLGTEADGIVSHQYSSYKSSNPGCLSESFQWESNPGSKYSPLIKAIQKKVGATQDGHIGPKTIKALQKYYGTTQDGYISKVSDVVKAMQKALNNGKF